MKSIAYCTGYTFQTVKSLVSRIPQPDVDKIKADFNQAIADQQQPKPVHIENIENKIFKVSDLINALEEHDPEAADDLRASLGIGK